ncbi:MAG: hypothetical protein II951_03440 [Bacteroidales bacterium]|nr:hypothetical protein [Bacteroidales bacterium]
MGRNKKSTRNQLATVPFLKYSSITNANAFPAMHSKMSTTRTGTTTALCRFR